MAIAKILVPYDGSKPSDMAVAKAVEIAKAFGEGSEVVLFHAVETIPLLPLTAVTLKSSRTGEPITAHEYVKEVYYELKASMTRTLEQKIKQYQGSGVALRHVVVVGSPPAGKIIEYAKKEGVDMIIIGRVGVRGFSRMLKSLGSVSRSVAERAPCPVMIVQ
ncbi:universal stress protein [Nitrososphaera sp.]|uniref:universal stress protein n=1 Tax=Nitrososphaera sp. TaxID=1971748 RepID=UPI00307E4811